MFCTDLCDCGDKGMRGGGDKGLHGAQRAGTGVVMMDMEEEDRLALGLGSRGAEAGRKNPFFCRITVC